MSSAETGWAAWIVAYMREILSYDYILQRKGGLCGSKGTEIFMILLIDNYDSFVYNLYQLAGGLYPDIEVVRNDAYSVGELLSKQPRALILSPGPGRPEDAGVCIEAIKAFIGKVPILGVCLGHQAICKAFGGKVTYASRLMHGKASEIFPEQDSTLFRGLPSPFKAARYHSLTADRASLPPELRITARSGDGEVMAVEHETHAVFGVQFHPESIMTPDGSRIMKNFLTAIVR